MTIKSKSQCFCSKIKSNVEQIILQIKHTRSCWLDDISVAKENGGQNSNHVMGGLPTTSWISNQWLEIQPGRVDFQPCAWKSNHCPQLPPMQWCTRPQWPDQSILLQESNQISPIIPEGYFESQTYRRLKDMRILKETLL